MPREVGAMREILLAVALCLAASFGCAGWAQRLETEREAAERARGSQTEEFETLCFAYSTFALCESGTPRTERELRSIAEVLAYAGGMTLLATILAAIGLAEAGAPDADFTLLRIHRPRAVRRPRP